MSFRLYVFLATDIPKSQDQKDTPSMGLIWLSIPPKILGEDISDTKAFDPMHC